MFWFNIQSLLVQLNMKVEIVSVVLISDCEELVWYLMEHLGINTTNYFMYQLSGPVRCHRLLIPQELYVPDLEQSQPEGGFSGTPSC